MKIFFIHDNGNIFNFSFQEEFRACSDIAIHTQSGWFERTPSTDTDTDGRISSYEESSFSDSPLPACAAIFVSNVVTVIMISSLVIYLKST